MALQYTDRRRIINGGLKAGGVGRNRDCEPVSGFIAMLWTLQLPGAVNMIVTRYLAIDRWLLELVLSTDSRMSSGV